MNRDRLFLLISCCCLVASIISLGFVWRQSFARESEPSIICESPDVAKGHRTCVKKWIDDEGSHVEHYEVWDI